MTFETAITLLIAAVATAGVIVRPWKMPEAIWAVAGAGLLVAVGLLPLSDAFHAIGKGTDVYLFLTGMMLLSELARNEGLFDQLAALAAKKARGSPVRLFLLVYIAGIIVTTFMSNDATAVVLTPAVFAAAKAAKAKPLPYLFICAFIANAASFVLPISNPANLVLFQSHMPPLSAWLDHFALPSLLSITVTFAILLITQRHELREPIKHQIEIPPLSKTAMTAAGGIGTTACLLMTASAFDLQLGWPTFLAAALTTVSVLVIKRELPWKMAEDISWGILPLVAGLFVLVEGLNHIGVIDLLRHALQSGVGKSATGTAWAAGVGIAFLCNAMNNLPAGLVSGLAVAGGSIPSKVTNAIFIGVDLGPNLSVTGSLATILWLTALRREGENVTAWQFIKLGLLLMPAALLAALAGLR